MITGNKSPIPLFDTLENLDATGDGIIEIAHHFKQDYTLACLFLHSYRGNATTFSAYRRELERFLQWCWLVAEKTIKDIRRNDFELFIEFCQHPPLSWIGVKTVARFIEYEGMRTPNSEWRPFVASLSKIEVRAGQSPDPKQYYLAQTTLQAIFSILSSFYNFLIQENYVETNPILQIRQKSRYFRKHQSKAVIRRLSELQWAYVLETAELMAKKDPHVHERTLFIMNALYGMYLRISELAASVRWTPQMGDFKRDSDGQWWFTTVGKGNKERDIAVSDAMLAALKRYRLSLGLSTFPTSGEIRPLLNKSSGQGPITSTRQIRKIVQHCFDEAIYRLIQDGFKEDAEQLMAATVHWLRHTGISEDVKIRPREHVRDDAGHGSSAITDKYIDVEKRARHASSRKKRIHPDKEVVEE